jgi:hypothetical protein
MNQSPWSETNIEGSPRPIQDGDNKYLEDGFWYLTNADRGGSTSDYEEWSPSEPPGYNVTAYPESTQLSSLVDQNSLLTPQPSDRDHNESADTNHPDLSAQETWEQRKNKRIWICSGNDLIKLD